MWAAETCGISLGQNKFVWLTLSVFALGVDAAVGLLVHVICASLDGRIARVKCL